jgi:hypothetical protein
MSAGSKPQLGWKELYKRALLEPDRTRVRARVAEAGTASPFWRALVFLLEARIFGHSSKQSIPSRRWAGRQISELLRNVIV